MDEERLTEELLQFLRLSANPQFKIPAVKHISGLTSDSSGISFILKHKSLLEAIISLLKDPVAEVSSDAYKTVINISADESAANCIVLDYDIITPLIDSICDPEFSFADEACQILSNLTRTETGSLTFLKSCLNKQDMDKEIPTMDSKSKLRDLINIFCIKSFNKSGANLDHLASVFANISQTKKGRTLLRAKENPVIGRLLSFLSPDSSSLTRRRGVSMTIKNCCFDYEDHEWLLGPELEILPQLLLPLAGGEEFTEAENEDLPLDLQYLPDDKRREPDPEIRRTLLETLLLLCADKFGRKFLKDSGTYYIIRELHAWEMKHGPEENDDQCEKLIQILIADEPEPGMENLMKIPDEKLEKVKT